jgi:hypothetical protein
MMKIIKSFEEYGNGWMWVLVTGKIYRTNREGEGLFYIDHGVHHYDVRQLTGTCQFSLPRERQAAMRKVRDEFREGVADWYEEQKLREEMKSWTPEELQEMRDFVASPPARPYSVPPDDYEERSE